MPPVTRLLDRGCIPTGVSSYARLASEAPGTVNDTAPVGQPPNAACCPTDFGKGTSNRPRGTDSSAADICPSLLSIMVELAAATHQGSTNSSSRLTSASAAARG